MSCFNITLCTKNKKLSKYKLPRKKETFEQNISPKRVGGVKVSKRIHLHIHNLQQYPNYVYLLYTLNREQADTHFQLYTWTYRVLARNGGMITFFCNWEVMPRRGRCRPIFFVLLASRLAKTAFAEIVMLNVELTFLQFLLSEKISWAGWQINFSV